MYIVLFILFFFIALNWSKITEEAERSRIEQEKKDRELLLAEQEKRRILEMERIKKRDADTQASPYQYECKGHPNITLAIRYGIANLKADNELAGEAKFIKLQKIKKIKDNAEGNHYLAKLVDFGNREVVVIIKLGSEYVQTFYPISESWFNKYANLEQILKDNKTFSLKELANFHVQKVIIDK